MTRSTIDNIKSRRSIRAYTQEPIKKEDIECIVEAGLYAPSANNTQNWQITVIKNKCTIEQFSHELLEENEDPTFDSLYGAPTLILVSTPADYACGSIDSSAVMENMLLAAHSIDLGGVWIGNIASWCNKKEIRALLTKNNVPKTHSVHAASVFGHPNETGNTRVNKGKVVYVD